MYERKLLYSIVIIKKNSCRLKNTPQQYNRIYNIWYIVTDLVSILLNRKGLVFIMYIYVIWVVVAPLSILAKHI